MKRTRDQLDLRVYQEPKNENISILVIQGQNARDKVEVYRGNTCRCPVGIHLRTLNKGVIASTVLVSLILAFVQRTDWGKTRRDMGRLVNNHPLLRMEAWEIENKIVGRFSLKEDAIEFASYWD